MGRKLKDAGTGEAKAGKDRAKDSALGKGHGEERDAGKVNMDIGEKQSTVCRRLVIHRCREATAIELGCFAWNTAKDLKRVRSPLPYRPYQLTG